MYLDKQKQLAKIADAIIGRVLAEDDGSKCIDEALGTAYAFGESRIGRRHGPKRRLEMQMLLWQRTLQSKQRVVPPPGAADPSIQHIDAGTTPENDLHLLRRKIPKRNAEAVFVAR